MEYQLMLAQQKILYEILDELKAIKKLLEPEIMEQPKMIDENGNCLHPEDARIKVETLGRKGWICNICDYRYNLD